MKIKIPSQLALDYITAHLTYNPDTGLLYKDNKQIGYQRKQDNRIVVQLIIGKTTEGHNIHYTCYLPQVAWYLTYGAWSTTYIDHIDGDRTNNRLSNLRLTTPSQNSYNVKKGKKITSSRFKGVNWDQGKWRAYITMSGKRHHIGRYPTEEEAAVAYDTKAVEVFGVYAKLNFGENAAVSGEMQQLTLPCG